MGAEREPIEQAEGGGRRTESEDVREEGEERGIESTTLGAARDAP